MRSGPACVMVTTPNGGSVMTGRRVLHLVVAILAVLVVVWLVLFLTRGDTSSTADSERYPDRPEGVAFVDEAVVHDDG